MTTWFLSKFILLIVCTLLLTACEKETNEHIKPSSFIEIFDDYWYNMDKSYVYWDIDSTNWDQIYLKYKPLFKELDLNNNSDVIRSYEYFQEITRDLIDCHYSISFTNSTILNKVISPAYVKKQKQAGFHYQYYYMDIDLNYLDSGYYVAYDYSNIGNGQPLTVVCGTINNEILYFSCNFFTLMKSYYSNSDNSIKQILNYFFRMLSEEKSNIKGVIVDVRGNPGGDLGDLNFFMGHFIEEPLHFGYIQSKSGNGRFDYTPWIKAFVNPHADGHKFEKTIVVLADNYSASLSEALVMAVCSLPNGIFIGENTWGATGPLTEFEVYNAGSFAVGDFMYVNSASCRFKYLDGKIYEGIGFTPDILVPFNFSELEKGTDSQLQKAIDVIRSEYKQETLRRRAIGCSNLYSPFFKTLKNKA